MLFYQVVLFFSFKHLYQNLNIFLWILSKLKIPFLSYFLAIDVELTYEHNKTTFKHSKAMGLIKVD